MAAAAHPGAHIYVPSWVPLSTPGTGWNPDFGRFASLMSRPHAVDVIFDLLSDVWGGTHSLFDL